MKNITASCHNAIIERLQALMLQDHGQQGAGEAHLVSTVPAHESMHESMHNIACY
jgi:hypothetical protein